MLEQILKGRGWKPVQTSRAGSPNVETWTAEGRRHILAIERAPDDRPETVRGRLALALLRANHLATPNASTAGVVTMRHLSRAAAQRLDEVGAIAVASNPHLGWAAIGDNGRAVFHLQGLHDSIEPRGASILPSSSVPLADPFSDRSLWVTKVLIKRTRATASNNWNDWMTGPNDYFGTYDAFADAVGVSTKTAWQTIRTLDKLGFVAGAAAATPLVRIEQLIERIRGATRAAEIPMPCRWLLPRRDSLQRLLSDRLAVEPMSPRGTRAVWRSDREQVCLASFSAARAHKFSVTSVRTEHLHVAPGVKVEALGLVSAEPGEKPDVVLHWARRPDSIFRAAVSRDGIPCADLFQTWLDVVDHPDRGVEQAAHIQAALLR